MRNYPSLSFFQTRNVSICVSDIAKASKPTIQLAPVPRKKSAEKHHLPPSMEMDNTSVWVTTFVHYSKFQGSGRWHPLLGSGRVCIDLMRKEKFGSHRMHLFGMHLINLKCLLEMNWQQSRAYHARRAQKWAGHTKSSLLQYSFIFDLNPPCAVHGKENLRQHLCQHCSWLIVCV